MDRNTSFRWRHRILIWVRHDRQLPLGGVVEADEMYFLEAERRARSYHSRLRIWLHHFRGVATRYLGNYYGWRWAIDLQRINSPAAMLRSAIGAFNS